MYTTTTGYYSRIRYFTSHSEKMGEVFSIIGGQLNLVDTPLPFNNIGGGFQNCITGLDASIYNGIFSGAYNCIFESNNNFIGGGFQNCTISGGDNATDGGNTNTIMGQANTIGGGNLNTIGNVTAVGPMFPAFCSFIGGGLGNCIDSAAIPTNFGTIGGGQSNYIGPSTYHASIFGGNGNILTGSCSAILGGFNNNDNGIPFTGIYGNGVIPPFAVPGVPSAFWVNELVVQNIVVDTTGLIYPTLPPGTLYTCAPLLSGYLQSPVFVR